MSNGIYSGFPREKYFELDAINSSTLKLFAPSYGNLNPPPARVKHNIDNPKEKSKAMELGDAIHTYILEPWNYEKLFSIVKENPYDWNTQRSDYLKFKKDHPEILGKTQITPAQDEIIKQVGKRFFEYHDMPHPEPDEVELTMCWLYEDEIFGNLIKYPAKGRLDLRYKKNPNRIFDAKTTRVSADAASWTKELYGMNYHMQMAFYLEGYQRITGIKGTGYHVVIENTAPYLTAIYEISESFIAYGDSAWQSYMKKYLECELAKQWDKGHERQSVVVEPPRYASFIQEQSIMEL